VTARSHYRGCAIYFDEAMQLWRYEDSDSPVRDHWKDRTCGKCGEPFTEKGHDPCIANLPGIQNACCGHGRDEEAYVQFEDERRESGPAAVSTLARLAIRSGGPVTRDEDPNTPTKPEIRASEQNIEAEPGKMANRVPPQSRDGCTGRRGVGIDTKNEGGRRDEEE